MNHLASNQPVPNGTILRIHCKILSFSVFMF